MSLIHSFVKLGREFVAPPWKKSLERNVHNCVKINFDNLTLMAQRIMALLLAVALFAGLFMLAAYSKYSKVRNFIVLSWEKPLERDSNSKLKINIDNLNQLV